MPEFAPGEDDFSIQLLPPEECLDFFKGGCSGQVLYRMPLSASGQSFPRCDHHWDLRLDQQQKINERYPDSPLPPDWFDPIAAGEVWDEEDY